MPWPQSLEYNEAMQSPALCFQDTQLRQGQPATDVIGIPKPCAGNFADVYKVSCPNQRVWAVKCFTREVPELQQRYEAISAHLQQAKKQAGLPFMVDFDYLDQGIRVAGKWYPILKMRWVEGFLLNEFVKDSLKTPQTLSALAGLWLKLARDLRASRMAHGDLQHGNVLFVPKPGGVSLKLIDYDGMFVPALAKRKSGELGHPNFQHPRRGDDPFHAEVDRFAHLVIYTALRCLAVGGFGLWGRYENAENLLFREEDFKTPGASPLFQELWKLRDPVARTLVGHLLLASQGPPRQVPLLDDLAGNGKAPMLTPAQEKQVEKLLKAGVSRVRPVPRAAPAPPAAPTTNRSPWGSSAPSASPRQWASPVTSPPAPASPSVTGGKGSRQLPSTCTETCNACGRPKEVSDFCFSCSPYRLSLYALAFSLVGCAFFPLGTILGPIAIIFGILGLRYTKANPDAKKGNRMAITGIVLGLLEMLLYGAALRNIIVESNNR